MQVVADRFTDGGEIGAAMRARDWSASPLGDPAGWPAALHTMISACLNSPMLGAVLWGPDLLMFYNDACIPSLGERHPSALGRPVAEVWGTTWERVSPPFYRCLETGHGFEERCVELPIERGGEIVATYWDFTATPIREHGAIVGLLNQGVEITARVHAEQQLRTLTASLERDVEARTRERDQLWALSEDLLVIANYDSMLLRVSPSWLMLTGKHEDVLLSEDYREITHPEDRAPSLAQVAAMRVTQQPVRFENRILAADGSWHSIAWMLSPEPGGRRFNGIGRDVTAERTAAATLRDTEDFARLALSAVGGVGVWTYDVASDVFTCDAAISALYGLDPERGAAGLKRSEFLANVTLDDRSPLQSVMSGGLLRPGDLELEYRIDHPDGSTRWVLSRGHTYFDPDGLPVRRTGIGIDMTKQRLLEEQLRQSQKMEALGQLTGGIAHDFNNLLTVIRGSADLLRRPNVSEDRRRRYIDAVADTADRASKLTSQLLSFARRQALKPEIFNAGTSVLALRDMIGTLTGSQIAVAIEVEDCPCHVRADRSQFDTAIVNMAVNARDAMGGEGTLTIRVSYADRIPAVRGHTAVDGAFVTVSLADTGSGIAADRIDQIFEPFITTKGVGEGTGLGLSQVFGFAKQSDGEIVVASAEGRGATFTLYLPSAPEPSSATTDRAVETCAIGTGARVLVVEDNHEVGTFATQALSELGYETVLATDGLTALAAIAADSRGFDVVFSDVVMPGMSGIELGQEIRRLHPTLPVVLTSGYSAVLARNGTFGFDLLHKPYSIDELSRVLRKVADRRPT